MRVKHQKNKFQLRLARGWYSTYSTPSRTWCIWIWRICNTPATRHKHAPRTTVRVGYVRQNNNHFQKRKTRHHMLIGLEKGNKKWSGTLLCNKQVKITAQCTGINTGASAFEAPPGGKDAVKPRRAYCIRSSHSISLFITWLWRAACGTYW